MTEAGYKTIVITGWTGLLAPTGTPQDIVDKLQKEIAARLLVPEPARASPVRGPSRLQARPTVRGFHPR